jgi:hypothetical protein
MVTPVKKYYELNDSIVPQLFTIWDGYIYYFDKLNQHEGRFYKNDGSKTQLMIEIGEAQGILCNNADIYSLQVGEKTFIKKYSLNGKVESQIELNGIFFDFKVNETGHFICLGYDDNSCIIKIINSDGIELGRLNPGNILFASCIYLQDDYIYLGAFDKSNIFKLMKINYIGSIEKEWIINVDSSDRIISKIIQYEDLFFITISGKNDSLVILNSLNNSIKEIYPQDMGLRDFIDICIYENGIFILDERCIHEYNIEDLINRKKNRRNRNHKAKMSLFPYQYLMCTRGAKEQLGISLNISAFITLCTFIYFYYKDIVSELGVTNLGFALFCLFWLMGVIIAVTASTVLFMNKSVRIEYLLNIYHNSFKRSFDVSIMASLTLFCISSLIFLPNLYIIENILAGLIFLVVTFYIDSFFIKKTITHNRDIVIELLSEEGQFKDYIKTVLDSVKERNSEKIYIDISFDGKIKNKAVTRWRNSRRNIIKDDVDIRINNNKISTVLDLSKRDVKYSKISILMDYICFIKDSTNIKEIEIGCIEDKGD